jgi:formate dehydrogenase major subunit
MVNLTINSKEIEVPEGTTVLRAAEKAGVFIPTLCDHPQLTPYGGCRLCIVEVKGFRVPIAACTLPASQGMVVETETPALKKSRQMILSLLFSERNHFCPFCQVSGGDCDLQNAAYREEMTSWPMQPNWTNFPVDTTHKYFILDNNRCILCRRCVRACAEMSGNFTLAIEERGAKSMIVADCNVPLGESSCISCGSCVQSCPTGALIDRQSAYLGHDESMVETRSVCTNCSVGCGIKVITRNNHVVRIEGDWDAPVNNGTLCKEGRFIPLSDDRKRITTPMVRKNGKLEPATWDVAMESVVEHLKPLAGKEHDGVAALVSTRLPVETMAAFKGLFSGGFKSDQVTSLEEGFPTATSAALAENNGAPIEGKLDMLRNADCVLVIGANLYDRHEVAGFLIKRSLPKGIQLIVIDPKENGFDDIAHYALKATTDTDVDVLRAIEAVIVKEGLGRTAAPIMDADAVLADALKKTGLAAKDILGAAHTLASAIAPVLIYGKGLTASGNSESLEVLLRLARLIGAVDSERIGVISVKGEANSLAASQLRLDKQFKMNGHKAVYVALGEGTPSKRMAERLGKAPYLVVQASYVSELTEKADVVLPGANWAEQEGHFLNLDGRLQKTNKSIEAPDGVRENTAVLADLANRVGVILSDGWKEALVERPSITALNVN